MKIVLIHGEDINKNILYKLLLQTVDTVLCEK